MELFVNVLFILLIIGIIYTFLRAPFEILGNALKGSIGLKLRMPLGPFGFLMPNLLEESRKDKRIKEVISNSTENPQNTTTIDLKKANTYLILQNQKHENSSLFLAEVESILGPQDQNFRYSIRAFKGSVIITLEGIDRLKDLFKKTHALSKSYGSEHTFGFWKSEGESTFFTPSPGNSGLMVGKTSDGKAFFYDLNRHELMKDHIIFQYQPGLNPQYSIEFFDALITLAHEQSV